MIPTANWLSVRSGFLEVLGVLMRFAVGILFWSFSQFATGVFSLTARAPGLAAKRLGRPQSACING